MLLADAAALIRRTQQLARALKDAGAAKPLAKTVATLLALRSWVDGWVADADAAQADARLRAQLERFAQRVQAIADAAGVAPAAEAPAVDDTPAAVLRARSLLRAHGRAPALWACAEAVPAGHTPLSWRGRRSTNGEPRHNALGCLQSIVAALRAEEQSGEFHGRLLRDQAAVVAGSDGGCAPDDLVYGTTPLDTWLSVIFGVPELLRALGGGPDAELAVFGCSAGWLGFYCAALFPALRVEGYDVLPGLVELAQRLADAHAAANVRFRCADMLTADVSRASAVVLMSQCWSDELFALTEAKLAAELKPGAVVVDYTRRLGLAPDRWGEVAAMRQPCSWDPAHEFVVYRLAGV